MRKSPSIAFAAVLFACATSKPPDSPPPVEVYSTGAPGEAAATRTSKMTATVLAVDTASRKLTLKGEDGKTDTVNVPPSVKRLNEITPGDRLEVEAQEGILFQYQPAGDAFVPPTAVVVAGRAGSSQPPGAAAAEAVQSTVTIVGIDLKTRIVHFQDPDGNKYEVKAGPQLSIEKLKIGDRLIATYTAAMAISIVK